MRWKTTGGKRPTRALKASELADEIPGIKVGIYGDSGSGKTSLACQGKDVLVLLTEPNGLASIKTWNPDATVCMVEDIEELHGWISELAGGERSVDADGAKIKTASLDLTVRRLVIDSFTELQRMLVDEILSGEKRESLTLQEWGLLNDRSIDLIRTVRNLPIDLCVIFLAETTEASDQRYIKPLVKGRKLPNECAQFFSAFGYAYRQSDDDGIAYRVLFGGSDRLISKQATGLKRIEIPNFSAWKEAILAATPEQVAEVDNEEENEPETLRRRRRSSRRSA